MPSQIKLFHNVYTSIGGYKTVFVSPDVSPPLARLFDRFSNLVYMTAGLKGLKGVVRCCGGGSIHFKSFQYGSDHVGRPRSCVHVIAVPPEEIRLHPFFNPLFIDVEPSFMTFKTPLRGFRERFPKSVAAKSMRKEHRRILLENFEHLSGKPGLSLPPPKRLLEMTTAIINPAMRLVLRGKSAGIRNALLHISGLLPPQLFSRFGWIEGHPCELRMDEVAPPSLFILPPRDKPEGLRTGDLYVDFNSHTFSVTDIPLDPWTKMVAGLAERLDPDDCADAFYEYYNALAPDAPSLSTRPKALETVLRALTVCNKSNVQPENVLEEVAPLAKSGAYHLAGECLAIVQDTLVDKFGNDLPADVKSFLADAPRLAELMRGSASSRRIPRLEIMVQRIKEILHAEKEPARPQSEPDVEFLDLDAEALELGALQAHVHPVEETDSEFDDLDVQELAEATRVIRRADLRKIRDISKVPGDTFIPGSRPIETSSRKPRKDGTLMLQRNDMEILGDSSPKDTEYPEEEISKPSGVPEHETAFENSDEIAAMLEELQIAGNNNGDLKTDGTVIITASGKPDSHELEEEIIETGALEPLHSAGVVEENAPENHDIPSSSDSTETITVAIDSEEDSEDENEINDDTVEAEVAEEEEEVIQEGDEEIELIHDTGPLEKDEEPRNQNESCVDDEAMDEENTEGK